MIIADIKEPWMPIEEAFAAQAYKELVREVGPKHSLRGKKAEAVARRQDCDDVLFILEGGGCAVVHLTFQGNEESDPRWPSTEIFSSIEEWRIKRMLPDHEDFVSL